MGEYIARFLLCALGLWLSCGDDEPAPERGTDATDGTGPDGDAADDPSPNEIDGIDGVEDPNRSDGDGPDDGRPDTDTEDSTELGDGGGGLPDAPVYATDCRPRGQGPTTEGVVFEPVLTGTEGGVISSPVQMLSPPDGSGRVFVVNQTGQILVAPSADDDAELAEWMFQEEAAEAAGGESGLLSMAFHPDFATNGRFFLSYTRWADTFQSVVREYSVPDPPLGAPDADQPSDGEVVFVIEQPETNHNGGQLAFGPDGYLYFGLGDGGEQGDPYGRGQDTSVLLAKILRLDVDSGDAYPEDDDRSYAIPADNPFVDVEGARPEIYALGFRNPWRFSFDSATGDLWVGDVGQGEWEEVDLVEAGQNYGWNTMEGTHCYNPSEGCDPTGLTLPIVDYYHDDGRCSVSGGAVYRGSQEPSLVGTYLFSDYCSGVLMALVPNGGGAYEYRELAQTGTNVSALGTDASGEMFVIDYAGNAVLRIAVDEASTGDEWVESLSDTGCFEDLANRTLSAGVLSYSVNAPLWSDGAEKERAFALPAGGRVVYDREEAWGFPEETVLIKTFLLEGAPVETRFLVLRDGAWSGATYQWNEEGTDAVLLDGAATVETHGQAWYFPSQNECLSCHTVAAGRVLGLRTPQMNRDGDLFGSGEFYNQIDALAEVGYFAEAPAQAAESLLRFPEPSDETAPLADRARAYLQGNCSHCHLPGGPTDVDMDLRYTTPFLDTATCGVEAHEHEGMGTQRIFPGNPEESAIWLRMSIVGDEQMPPLARNLVDESGSALVFDWISSFSECP